MSPESKSDMTLVINTAQKDTYERFDREKGNLLSGDVRLYDTAHVYPDYQNLACLKPGIFSYLKVLRREKPKTILVTYDGSRSSYFYLNIGLFMVVAHILGKQVNYYSQVGNYAVISDAIPAGWPFAPFFLLRSSPRILAAYIRCFFSPETRGRVMGFNKFFAPITFWYETVGNKQLQYGCWGYCYIDEFGDSQRERFFHHYLSYGYMPNELGFQRYHALAAVLYLISFFVVFIVSGNWLWGLILLPILLISPYYTFSFLAHAKPENIAWFLALPIFYCAAEGFIVPLAVLLLLSTYLSFTMFFFTSAGVVALLCSQLNPALLLAFVPAGIKLLVDFYFVARSDFFPKLLHIASGRGGEKRSVAHRQYGIGHIPPQYIALLMLSIILLIAQLVLHTGSWPVAAMFVLLLFVNFWLVRMADAQSFYPFFLSMLLFGLLLTANVYFLIAGAFVLLANPRWVDDFRLMTGQDSQKTYPPAEKVVWTKEQDSSLAEFIGAVKPGSRVLFEYTGHVFLSPFSNILSVLEAKLYDENVELLPHEITFYFYPHFSYDLSCHLSPSGDLDAMDKLLQCCSISYVMVFSEDLLNRLLKRDYQLISKFKLDNLRGFIHDSRIPSEEIYLLYCGRDSSFCSEHSVVLERQPNRMILKGVRAGSEYIIHYTYHKDWKAYQGWRRLIVSPIEVAGLEFMRVKAQDSHDIVMRFGRINHIVR